MSEYIDRFIQGGTVKNLRDNEALHNEDLEALVRQYITDVVVEAAETAAAAAAASEAEAILEALSNTALTQYRQSANVSDASIPVVFNITDYTYSSEDIIQVYLNGLHALPSEYSVSGSGSAVSVTLTNVSFTGTLDIVITKFVVGVVDDGDDIEY